MSTSTRLAKNTLVYALGDIIPRAFSLITFPVLTSYLQPEDYGITNYIYTINSILIVLGLLSMNTYYLVFYYRLETEEERRKLLGNIFSAQVIFNVLMSVVLFILGPWLFDAWGSKVHFYPFIAIGILTNVFDLLAIMPSAHYRVIENPLPLTIIRILKGMLSMVLVILAVKYYEASALTVLSVNLLISILFGILFLIITLRYAKLNVNIPQLKKILSFSLPLLPGALSHFLYSASDRMLIEKYLSLSDLGIYSTAFTLAFLLSIVNQSSYHALEPYFFKTFGEKGFEQNFEKVRDIFLFMVLVCALFLGIYSREFFIIFSSEKYHQCYLYVPILLIGAVFAGVRLIYGTIIMAREKTKTTTMITLTGGAFSIAMNAILLKHLGIMGSTIISAMTYTVLLLMSIKYADIRVHHAKPVKAIAIAFSLVFCIVYVQPFYGLWYSIPLKSFEVCLVIFLLMKLLHIDIRYILKLIKR